MHCLPQEKFPCQLLRWAKVSQFIDLTGFIPQSVFEGQKLLFIDMIICHDYTS